MLERYDEAVDAYEASTLRDAHGHWAAAAAECAVVAALEVAREEPTSIVPPSMPLPSTWAASQFVRVSDA